MLSLKGTKLYSVLHFKCPFCHEGDFFISHAYDLAHVGELHPACPVCHRKYTKEPGFYWGAMFVSYVLSISFSLLAFGLLWLLTDGLGIVWYFTIIVGLTILAAPCLYALSKIIWANLFFSYQGSGTGAA